MPKIEHVVALVMENRSFDHMLGHLKATHPDVDGVTEADRCPWDPAKPHWGEVSVTFDGLDALPVDPGHEFDQVSLQVFGTAKPAAGAPARMNGFVASYGDCWHEAEKRRDGAPDVMRCQPADRVPILSELASEFAVCDRWFCSVPSMTWPNRYFVLCGTSGGSLVNKRPPVAVPTAFEALEKVGKTWKIYYHDVAQSFAITGFQAVGNVGKLSRLLKDIENDALPSFSFVEPAHFVAVSSQHSHNGNIWAGERLVGTIYNALRARPDVFRKTLFVVTYDEHGGFYDHVPPPAAVPPDAHGHEFAFDRLGPRVPAVVISPWIARRKVDHTVRDHTTILATLREVFGIAALGARDAASPSLLGLLTTEERGALPGPFALPDGAWEAPPAAMSDNQAALAALTAEMAGEPMFAGGPTDAATGAADVIRRMLDLESEIPDAHEDHELCEGEEMSEAAVAAVPLADPMQPLVAGALEPSGAQWVDRFPGSRSVDGLVEPFRAKVVRFLGALSGAGATLKINATYRPPERAWLMHFSWRIARKGLDARSVPAHPNIPIQWWHGTEAASMQAAEAMVQRYRTAVTPALQSNHTRALAIDVRIGWTGALTVMDAAGRAVVIASEPRDGTNPELAAVGASYGVLKLANDPPHWSHDGR
jgi:phospholipase C